MGIIKDYIDKLKEYTPERQAEDVYSIFIRYTSVILDLNTDQLMHGYDSEGQPLEPYKSAMYAEFKLTLNPRGVVDLKLTGDFHNSFYISSKEFPLTIDAKDSKRNKLVTRYGIQIFNLTEESKKILFAGYVQGDVNQYYRGVYDVPRH